MDRYNDVKLQLKSWEKEFVQNHQRKPNKDDIDQAPEVMRNLYKEYRTLKQTNENSSSDAAAAAANHHQQAKPEKSDCWGSHLNRSVLPASSPKLTSKDRDSLQASAQYYGLKLKQNLGGALTKDKPVSLKKSALPGRLPLNSLTSGGQAGGSTPSLTDKSPSNGPFSPRVKASSGSLASNSKPEEPEEPFECVKEFDAAPSDPVSVKSHISVSSFQNVLHSSPAPSSASWKSFSPPKAGDDVGTLNDSANSSLLRTPCRAPGRASFMLSPQVGSDLRPGAAGRATPTNRLSSLNRKWLERCQVFGEMEAEEKPGAGNQEVQEEKNGEMEEKEGGEGERGGQEVADHQIGGEEVVGKSNKGGETKRKKRKGGKEEGVEREATPPPAPEAESQPEGKGTKKRGRKREREGDDAEEAVKKRRRGKKKEEKEDGKVSSPGRGGEGKGGKKRRTKKTGEEEEEEEEGGEEEKKVKEPKKMPQENLLGEVEEEFVSRRMCQSQPINRAAKGDEGNFVKINLKKKSHVRGYALRGLMLRKQLYMQKFALKGERVRGGGFFGRGGFRGRGINRQGDTCYKCGGTGHWAMDCKGPAPPPSSVSLEQAEEEEVFEPPTLEEVARATGTLGPQPLPSSPSVGQDQQKEPEHEHKDEMLLNVIRPDYEKPAPPPPIEPLFPLTDDGKVQETPAEVFAALKDLGYESFRAGQEEAIMRILSGLSTLVVLSTGMGKSLCYQLPAYLYSQRSSSITLVISPLVSLMDDQLSGVPAKLKAACIHSNMTMKQREAAIEKVKSGQVCVLLLSPESLVGGGRSGQGCLPSAQELPPVAFACIDEAHCVSEWSHNFRPCYLRLCKVLRERLGVRCLLGLTATATLSTAMDIALHLDITDQDGIAVRSAAVPPNLQLSVSMDPNKDQALVSLLRGDRFGCLDSVIVYCTRREETTRVSALLRTALQGVLLKENKDISQKPTNSAAQKKKDQIKKKIRKPLKWQAESYHAGLTSSERRRVQNNFMCGELRIVVATVAFGMGLDKSDVRGIVHFNMPKSFESYVQEIGRAGRDGEASHCHLFLDTEGGDLHELRRHIYGDTVDHYTVKRLLQKVFPPCKCKQIHAKQQELVKDIDDSELLEMMDMCDEASSVNLPTQQNKEESSPAAAQKETSHLDSEEAPAQENGGEGEKKEEEEEEEEEQEVAEAEGAGSSAGNQEVEEKSERVVLMRREHESSDWPRERVCHTHERAIPIQQTVEALDITEEGVETLLCYLELHPQRFVELLHPTMSVCKLSCYHGPRQLQKITKICPPAAVVLARMRMAGQRVDHCDQLQFDVVEVADTMGWQLTVVKRGLRQLQWSTDRGGGRSGIQVEFSDPSFYFRSYGDLSPEEMDRVCHFLHNRVQEQERTQLYQLTACFKAFKSVAFQSASSCIDDLDARRSLQLKNLLSEYFDKRRDREQTLKPLEVEELEKYKISDWEGQIRADIRSFLSNRSDEKFSGRAVARILHGIASPCYPAQTYGRDRRYWRKYIQFDFNQLIRLATQEIIHLK